MDFLLFLLVTFTLFVRPAELVPEWSTAPIYEVLIISGLVVSLEGVFRQLAPDTLVRRPITLCVLGMLLAIVVSHLSHFIIWMAQMYGTEFAKVLAYFLLMAAVLRTPQRLQWFMLALLGCIVVLAGMALLDHHAIIDVPSIEAVEEGSVDPITGEMNSTFRLQSTGIFNDPNDLSFVVVVGMVIATYWLTRRDAGLMRPLALAALVVLGYAFVLTQSRGGMLALLTAVMVLFHARFGWKKAAFLALFVLPLMFLAFQGRQTSISAAEGTSQERIQYWSMAFELMQRSPVFGIGAAMFEDYEVRRSTHNSFVECYAGLGIFGGTIFFAMYFIPITALYRLGQAPPAFDDPELNRLRPYLMSMLLGSAISQMSICRCYVVPTYMIVGLAASYLSMVHPSVSVEGLVLDGRLVRRCGVASVVFLVFLYVFTRVNVRWG